MENQKNILIILLTCVVAWLGLEVFLKPSSPPVKSSENKPLSAAPLPALSPQQALASSPRVPISTPRVKGSIALKGALIDDWTLRQYHETADRQSPLVALFKPWPSAQAYYTAFRWYTLAGSRAPEDVPHDETVWAPLSSQLTEASPLTLEWKNAQGVIFQQVFEIDDYYRLTVKQIASNPTPVPVTLGTQSLIKRRGPVSTGGHMMLYEGPLGVFSGRLKEVSYESALKGAPLENLGFASQGTGWIGLTDKYWLSALIPSHDEAGKTSQGGFNGISSPLTYQVEKTTSPVILMPGQSHTVTTHLFAGPKQLSLLEKYEKTLGIHHFDLAVDFGWFYFLTRPMFVLLSWLNHLGGSFSFAILLMTVLIKLAFFPLSLKSYRSMARMKRFQPQLEALKTKYGEDKVRMNQEIMNLYRREKINPVSGCLPMLIQIPIFFALYKVLFVSIEMRQAPFWGWIRDLSAPDPTTIFNGFGLFPWSVPEWLHIGIWPLLMGLTMILQQRMNTTVALDSHQKLMFTYVMPTIFALMLAKFPVGLVIYWTWSNTLTILQQWVMTRYYQPDPAA